MTTQPNYLRYLEAAKQAETAAQLRNDGYSVETESKLEGLEFDLVATRNDKKIVYEFKSVGNSRLDRDKLRQLQQAARTAGYEFRIVVVNPPPRVNIQIDNLTDELLEYISERIPDELNLLSSNTQIDGVVDLEISDIRVSESGIKIKGSGAIDVTLIYGGSSDNVANSDAYPFDFAATLGPDNSLASVDKLTVNTSSFYE